MKKQYGLKLSLPLFFGRIHSDYLFEAFTEAISDCRGLLDAASSGEILLMGRNRVGAVKMPVPGGNEQEVVIKEYRTLGIDKLKSIFLPSKAVKAWKGSSLLSECGIKTPFPIAYLEKRKGIFLDQSFFLSARIHGFEEIRYRLKSSPVPDGDELLEQLAHFLSGCFEQGIVHRDLSDGNILVKKDSEGRFEFYMIDTNRIRSKKTVGSFSRVKNLIRLGIPSRFQRFFLNQFFEPKPIKKRYWLWYKLNKNVYTGFFAFKKRLRLKKLAQKLKIQ